VTPRRTLASRRVSDRFCQRNVQKWHVPEMPIAASDGRLQVQNGLWRGIHGRIYEFMA
jgi:hypothetical protein